MLCVKTLKACCQPWRDRVTAVCTAVIHTLCIKANIKQAFRLGGCNVCTFPATDSSLRSNIASKKCTISCCEFSSRASTLKPFDATDLTDRFWHRWHHQPGFHSWSCTLRDPPPTTILTRQQSAVRSYISTFSGVFSSPYGYVQPSWRTGHTRSTSRRDPLPRSSCGSGGPCRWSGSQGAVFWRTCCGCATAVMEEAGEGRRAGGGPRTHFP